MKEIPLPVVKDLQSLLQTILMSLPTTHQVNTFVRFLYARLTRAVEFTTNPDMVAILIGSAGLIFIQFQVADEYIRVLYDVNKDIYHVMEKSYQFTNDTLITLARLFGRSNSAIPLPFSPNNVKINAQNIRTYPDYIRRDVWGHPSILLVHLSWMIYYMMSTGATREDIYYLLHSILVDGIIPSSKAYPTWYKNRPPPGFYGVDDYKDLLRKADANGISKPPVHNWYQEKDLYRDLAMKADANGISKPPVHNWYQQKDLYRDLAMNAKDISKPPGYHSYEEKDRYRDLAMNADANGISKPPAHKWYQEKDLYRDLAMNADANGISKRPDHSWYQQKDLYRDLAMNANSSSLPQPPGHHYFQPPKSKPKSARNKYNASAYFDPLQPISKRPLSSKRISTNEQYRDLAFNATGFTVPAKEYYQHSGLPTTHNPVSHESIIIINAMGVVAIAALLLQVLYAWKPGDRVSRRRSALRAFRE